MPGRERSARAALDDAEAALHAREARHHELTVRLDLAREALTDPGRAECATEAAELGEEMSRLDAEAEAVAPTQAALASAETEALRIQGVLGQHQSALSSLEQSLAQSEPLFDRLRVELDGALARHDADTLATAIRTLGAQVRALELVQAARLRCEASYADLERNRRALADASREAGFRDAGELQAALLTPERRDAIEALVSGVRRAARWLFGNSWTLRNCKKRFLATQWIRR